MLSLGLQEGARHLVANDRSTSTRDGVAAGLWSTGHAPRALAGIAKELRWIAELHLKGGPQVHIYELPS